MFRFIKETFHRLLESLTVTRTLTYEWDRKEVMQNDGIEIFHSKYGDYRTRDAVFEIDGKNKTREQLREAKEHSYLVKDDILHPLKGEIPLFLFGFLY